MGGERKSLRPWRGLHSATMGRSPAWRWWPRRVLELTCCGYGSRRPPPGGKVGPPGGSDGRRRLWGWEVREKTINLV
jgi:hypothetical protein